MTEFRAGVGEVNACYQNGFLLRVIEDQAEFIQKTACLFQVCLSAVLRETFLERTAKDRDDRKGLVCDQMLEKYELEFDGVFEKGSDL